MSSGFERERERVIRYAQENPQPCLVCRDPEVRGIGTWIPDERHYLAAGGNSKTVPVFAFWLCEGHSDASAENEKLIRQAVLRSQRH